MTPPQPPFGARLVDAGFITRDQLDEAIKTQDALRKIPIGEMLVDAGILNHEDLEEYLLRHLVSLNASDGTRKRFGDFLVQEALVTSAAIGRAKLKQDELRQRRIGDILVALGHLTPKRLEEAVQKILSFT